MTATDAWAMVKRITASLDAIAAILRSIDQSAKQIAENTKNTTKK
jgi:hypothetical protein